MLPGGSVTSTQTLCPASEHRTLSFRFPIFPITDNCTVEEVRRTIPFHANSKPPVQLSRLALAILGPDEPQLYTGDIEADIRTMSLKRCPPRRNADRTIDVCGAEGTDSEADTEALSY